MGQPIRLAAIGATETSATALGASLPVSLVGGTSTIGSVSNFPATVDTGTDGATANTLRVAQAPGGAGTDSSGTLTASGAQQPFGTAGAPNGYFVANPNATAILWIKLGGTATTNGAGCIQLAALTGTYSTPPGMKPPGAISVFGTASGNAYTAHGW